MLADGQSPKQTTKGDIADPTRNLRAEVAKLLKAKCNDIAATSLASPAAKHTSCPWTLLARRSPALLPGPG